MNWTKTINNELGQIFSEINLQRVLVIELELFIAFFWWSGLLMAHGNMLSSLFDQTCTNKLIFCWNLIQTHNAIIKANVYWLCIEYMKSFVSLFLIYLFHSSYILCQQIELFFLQRFYESFSHLEIHTNNCKIFSKFAKTNKKCLLFILFLHF